MVFEEIFRRFRVTVCKKGVLQKRKFSYTFIESVSYNDVVVTNKFTFHPHYENHGFTYLTIL